MNTFRPSLTLVLLATIGFGVWSGCDTIFGGERAEAPASLHVLLTDAPFPEELIEEVNVTITEIQLLPGVGHDGQGAMTLKTTWETGGERQGSISYNLLELRDGVTASLADNAEITPGPYSQMRVLIEPQASLVDTAGTVYDLAVSRDLQTGVKTQLDTLELAAGSETTVTLDFNVEDSFILADRLTEPADIHEMTFDPVIRLQEVHEGPPGPSRAPNATQLPGSSG